MTSSIGGFGSAKKKEKKKKVDQKTSVTEFSDAPLPTPTRLIDGSTDRPIDRLERLDRHQF